MGSHLPAGSQIEDALHFVHQTLPPTPQICWPLVCERAGTEVWLKHENHQPVGAFKVRGGMVFMRDLATGPNPPEFVVTATRGNHGQSIAFAACRFGIKPLVVVPHGNSKEKNRAMCSLGAELIEHGEDFNEAADYAAHLAGERGALRLPSFHELLVCGVATYWVEFFRAVPDLDAVFVPIGLGSGICAAAAARSMLNLKTEIVGVVSASAPAYALSFEQSRVVEHPASTAIADGVAVRCPHEEALMIIQREVSRIVQVTDRDVKNAMKALFVDTHNVVEGAGAAPLAALLNEREQFRGKKVGLAITGGNVDHDVFARVLLEV